MRILRYLSVSVFATLFFTVCLINSTGIEQISVYNNLLTGKEMINKNQDTVSNDIISNVNSPKAQITEAEMNVKTVVIDPGHANQANLEKEPNAPGSNVMKFKDGGGATGTLTKTPEHVINMEVAKRLKKLLEEKGFKVIMTKTEHSQRLGNVERAMIGNRAKPNLVIRIHCDSNDNSKAAGATMLVPKAINSNTIAICEESKRCGQIVLNTLVSQVGMQNRGVVLSSNMTGFNWSEVPVILIELGFLSNQQEDKLLNSSSYQDKLAKGLAEGIAAALRN